jgi:hypothetical protein
MDATRAVRRHLSAHEQHSCFVEQLGEMPMRTTAAMSIAAALTAIAIGSSGAAFATSRTSPPVVRDHRTPPSAPIIRDHRTTPAPVIRDHRTPSKAISVHPEGRRVIRAGRNYDKTTNRVQVIVDGKRVPRRVDVVR